MIHYLNGMLTEKNPAYIVIDCNGVGYFLNISLHTFSKIPDSGTVHVFTHLQISEDAHTLYGFADEEERRLFRQLITVSGIGCNTARMMLSSMDVQEIEQCIVSDDFRKLQGIKGIGEKTAQRVILELKNKLRKEGHIPASGPGLKVKEEARSALLTLGFSRPAIDKTLDQLLKTQGFQTVEELVKHALKAL